MKPLLDEAQKNKYAVGAFNAGTVETMEAIIEAAEEMNTPVILNHAQCIEEFAPIKKVAPYLISIAKQAAVPVAVNLDHGLDFEYIVTAINLGFTSIMSDFSVLDYEENVKNVKRVVDICKACGISSEGLLGVMPSNVIGLENMPEDMNIKDFFTKPNEARDFTERTGLDALAISFGTVHGLYFEKPQLDIDLLHTIRKTVKCNLTMHGGSGVDSAQIKAAIDNGISKINYYTYMSNDGVAAMKKVINESKIPPYIHELAFYSKKAMRENVKRVIELFNNGYKKA
jgi:fructose-bisphosphate aldolase class II